MSELGEIALRTGRLEKKNQASRLESSSEGEPRRLKGNDWAFMKIL
jgi:hypothetical protein